MASKFHFSNIKRFSSPWKSSKESVNGKYVRSGEDNIFPQHLIELYNQSSIHAAAVNATVEAIIGEPIINEDGRRIYARAVVEKRGDQYFARLTGSQGSGILTSMASANGLVIVPEDKPGVEAGDVVQVMMLDWNEEEETLR